MGTEHHEHGFETSLPHNRKVTDIVYRKEDYWEGIDTLEYDPPMLEFSFGSQKDRDSCLAALNHEVNNVNLHFKKVRGGNNPIKEVPLAILAEAGGIACHSGDELRLTIPLQIVTGSDTTTSYAVVYHVLKWMETKDFLHSADITEIVTAMAKSLTNDEECQEHYASFLLQLPDALKDQANDAYTAALKSKSDQEQEKISIAHQADVRLIGEKLQEMGDALVAQTTSSQPSFTNAKLTVSVANADDDHWRIALDGDERLQGFIQGSILAAAQHAKRNPSIAIEDHAVTGDPQMLVMAINACLRNLGGNKIETGELFGRAFD